MNVIYATLKMVCLPKKVLREINMPIDYNDYPDNWKWLSKQVIKDANNKCELCYAPNGELVLRVDNTYGHPFIIQPSYFEVDDDNLTKIVLTVHHINGNKQDSRKQNLIALCQKCHLRLDLLKHMDNRAKSKSKLQESLKI